MNAGLGGFTIDKMKEQIIKEVIGSQRFGSKSYIVKTKIMKALQLQEEIHKKETNELLTATQESLRERDLEITKLKTHREKILEEELEFVMHMLRMDEYNRKRLLEEKEEELKQKIKWKQKK